MITHGSPAIRGLRACLFGVAVVACVGLSSSADAGGPRKVVRTVSASRATEVAHTPESRSGFVGSESWLRAAEFQALYTYKGRTPDRAIAFLVKSQRPDGSWSGEGLDDRGSYDDQCTATALRALLEWHAETGDTSVVAPAKKCIELLLRTQGKELAPVGKPYEDGPFCLRVGGLWRMVPDPAEWRENWWTHLDHEWNLGDGVTSGNANALAMAYAIFGDERCKDAVLNCARSLLKLQALHSMGLPEHVGPRGEAMHGRPHEIPAWSTRAVSYAIDVYVDAHRVSRDNRWAKAARMSADWLDKLKLSDRPLSFQGQRAQIMWPSLVEINTLRPVYGNAHGMAVYTVEEALNPYGWWNSYPAAAIDKAKRYFVRYAQQW